MAGKFVQGNWLLPNNVNANKQSNYSLNFNGSNSVNCGNISTLNGLTKATWSCWYKKTASGSKYFMGNWGANVANAKQFLPYQYSSGMEIYMGNNASGSTSHYTMFSNLDCGISQDTWHHMTFVFDASESSNADKLKFYLNGTQITNSAAGFALTSLNSVTTDFILGAPFSPYLTGQLDEVCIFPRALSSSEVNSLYNSGTPGNPFNLSGDPIAYYKLGETAIGQAPGGTWNWQVPNHAQSQFAWQMQGGTSPRLAPGITPKQLGTTHTLSTWFNANVSTASGFFYSLSNISTGSIQTQLTTPYSGLVINDNGPYVSSSTQDIRYRVNNVDLIFTIPANIDVTDGNWHNVILVRTGGTAKCYLDGQEITNPTGSLSSTEEFAFELLSSTSKGGATPQWPGKISNFAVWKSDQSANKDNIYNNGEPQSVYTATPDYWWKLDNSSTTNVLGNLVSKNSSISTYPYSERCIVMAGGLSYNTSGGGPSLMFANEVNLGESNSISIWMSGFDLQDQYINNGHIYGGVDQYKWGIFGNTNGSFIVAKFTNATTWNLWYYLGTNTGEYVELTIDQSTYPSVFTTIVSSNFYNLLFVRDGNNLEVFFNNSSIGTGTFTLGESTNTLVNAIGRDGNNTSTPINNGYKMGKSLALDDVTLFNKALSASERTTLYNNGKPGDNTSLSPTAWIRMGDDVDVANNRLIDYSGNGNYVNFSNWDQLYVRDIESVTSIGDTSVSLALAATDLGLHNPLYSQFSTLFNSNYFIIPDSPTTAVNNNSSISFWVKTNTTGNRHGILNKRDGGGQVYYVYVNTNNTIAIDGGGAHQFSTGAITQGEWAHVALTISSGSVIFYINGSSAGTGTVNLTADDAPTYLGSKTGGADPSNAYLSNVALFIDKTLTASEVISIYNNGKPSDISSLSPTVWWKLGDAMYTNSSNKYLLIDSINGNNSTSVNDYAPSISADAPKVVAPGSSSGLVELDKKGDSPNSTSNSISYNILKTDQSIYTPKYVSQYTVDNNYSMAFDGTGYMPLGSSINIGKENTIAFWVYKTNTNAVITGEASYGNDYNIYISSTQGTYYRVGSAAYWSYNIPNNTWKHVAITRNQTALKLYVNGVSLGSNTAGAITSTTDTKFDTIGDKSNGSHDGGASPFIGKLDEFAAWDKELTADQIKFDIYEASATANKSADFINNPNLPDPVAWYRMGD